MIYCKKWINSKGAFDEKILLLLFILVALCLALISCNFVPNELSTDTSSNEKNQLVEDEQGNKYHGKYYREIGTTYTKIADGVNYEKDQIFLDGVFEMNQKSQCKIISSHDELQAFTLLNYGEIENDIFDDNYIVAVLHYFKGSSIDETIFAGYYDIDLKDSESPKIELDTYLQYGLFVSTEDIRDVYQLHFLVVEKEEIDYSNEICNINVNENELEQYDMEVFAIENVTDTTKAYYVESKEELEALGLLKNSWIYTPCVAIHLSEKIKTDCIVNDLRYENGEIFITVEVFEKTEMVHLHEISANLILVPLKPNSVNIPDNIPTNCKVNVTFELMETGNGEVNPI